MLFALDDFVLTTLDPIDYALDRLHKSFTHRIRLSSFQILYDLKWSLKHFAWRVGIIHEPFSWSACTAANAEWWMAWPRFLHRGHAHEN